MFQAQEDTIKIVVYREGLSFSHSVWQGDVQKNNSSITRERAQEIIDANPEGQIINGNVLDFGTVPVQWKWQVLLN
ncbi:MAG: hypothetical protein AAF490_26555 [Chloroflexota bacterium]